MHANIASNAKKSRVEAVPENDNDQYFEGAVVLDEAERVGFKQLFRDLQKSCRDKHRKVPGTIVKAVKLADELVKGVGESCAQVANDAAPATLPSVETDFVLLSAKLKKTHEDAVSARAKLDARCVAVKVVTKERNVALAKVREEW